MALFGNKKTKEGEEDKSEKKVAASKKVSVKKEVKKEEAVSMKDLYAEKEGKKSSSAKSTTLSKARPAGKILSARTLVKPLVTEKAANLAATGKYVFKVAMKSNKIEVAKAISDTYGVEVDAVNIVRMKGKAVSRGKIKGTRSDFKKAIVTLKKGQSIQIYEGV